MMATTGALEMTSSSSTIDDPMSSVRHDASRLMISAAAIVVCVLGMLGGVARAGDGAAAEIIGFSADGRYFAFEQYGEEDGSGALYSEIAIIDVAANRFVAGTPASGSSRTEAAEKAAALLRRLHVARDGEDAGAVATSRAREVIPPKDINRLMEDTVADMPLAARAVGAGAHVTLQTADAAAPHCRDLALDGQPQGFTLALEIPGRAPTILHRDLSVPRSRGCPDHYGVAGAWALRTSDGAVALAVLIQYFYVAFEGHNRRFLAITARLPRVLAVQ